MQHCNPLYLSLKDYGIGDQTYQVPACISCFLPPNSSYKSFWQARLAGIFNFPQRNAEQTLHWSRTMPEWAAALQWPWANCRKPEGKGTCLGQGTGEHHNQWVLCQPPHDASLLTAQDKFISVPKSKRWLSQGPIIFLHTLRHSPFGFALLFLKDKCLLLLPLSTFTRNRHWQWPNLIKS